MRYSKRLFLTTSFYRNTEKGTESLQTITATNRQYIHVICLQFARFGAALATIPEPTMPSISKTVIVIKFATNGSTTINETACIASNYTAPVSGIGSYLDSYITCFFYITNFFYIFTLVWMNFWIAWWFEFYEHWKGS